MESRVLICGTILRALCADACDTDGQFFSMIQMSVTIAAARCHFVVPACLLYQRASLRLSHPVTLLWRKCRKWLFNHAERAANQKAQAE